MRRALIIAGAIAVALSPLAVAVGLSSCVEHDRCGPPPSAPGWVVNVSITTQGPLACMAVDDYSKIRAYHVAVEVWGDCMEGRPR